MADEHAEPSVDYLSNLLAAILNWERLVPLSWTSLSAAGSQIYPTNTRETGLTKNKREREESRRFSRDLKAVLHAVQTVSQMTDTEVRAVPLRLGPDEDVDLVVEHGTSENDAVAPTLDGHTSLVLEDSEGNSTSRLRAGPAPFPGLLVPAGVNVFSLQSDVVRLARQVVDQ